MHWWMRGPSLDICQNSSWNFSLKMNVSKSDFTEWSLDMSSPLWPVRNPVPRGTVFERMDGQQFWDEDIIQIANHVSLTSKATRVPGGRWILIANWPKDDPSFSWLKKGKRQSRIKLVLQGNGRTECLARTWSRASYPKTILGTEDIMISIALIGGLITTHHLKYWDARCQSQLVVS